MRVDAPSVRERVHDDLAAAVIAGGVACATDEEAKRAAKLEKRLFRRMGQRRALGTAALELAWAAAGRIDVVYHEQRIHPWDVDAGLFICQRAGLRVHRLEPLEPELAPRFLAAPPPWPPRCSSSSGRRRRSGAAARRSARRSAPSASPRRCAGAERRISRAQPEELATQRAARAARTARRRAPHRRRRRRGA